MSMETEIYRSTQNAINETAKTTDIAIKKAWSILDAASEKKLPGDVLSPQAVKAIQGSGG